MGFWAEGEWGKVKQGYWEEIRVDVGLIRSLKLTRQFALPHLNLQFLRN